MKLYEFFENKNILYTEITTNSVEEYCYDIYLLEQDYLLYKEEIHNLLYEKARVEKTYICEICFYKFDLDDIKRK